MNRIKLTAGQEQDLRAITHGPRGGLLRGRNRPTIAAAEKAFARWPDKKRAWSIVWLILLGRIR
jgi:hypothetical protein